MIVKVQKGEDDLFITYCQQYVTKNSTEYSYSYNDI